MSALGGLHDCRQLLSKLQLKLYASAKEGDLHTLLPIKGSSNSARSWRNWQIDVVRPTDAGPKGV